MSLDWDEMKEVWYQCVKCGHKFKGEECVIRGRIVCPLCNYRVLKKIRPPIVKRVKAI